VLKILEAGCLVSALAFAAPALAQEEVPDTIGPPVTDEIAEDTMEAAEEDTEGEKFPIGGSLSLGYSFSHSNFVSAADDSESEAAEQYGLDDVAPPAGSQFLGLDVGLSYSVVESVSLSAGIGVVKTVADGYLGGSSGSSLVNHETNLTDTSLGAKWSAYTIPVADIKVSVSGGARLPTSKTSLTQGLIVGLKSGVSLSRKLGPVSLSVTGGYTHNIWEDPTQQIEPIFADLVRISGPDLGQPLPLSGWSTGFSASWAIIEPLSLSIAYTLSGRVSSVEGKDDAFTSEQAQVGTQYSTGAHGVASSLSYTLPFDTGTSISAQMATNMKLYNIDGSGRINNPLFDTESRQGAYTGYSLSISQAL